MLIRQRGEGVFFDAGQQKSRRVQPLPGHKKALHNKRKLMVFLSLQLMLIRQRGEGVFFDVGQQKSRRVQGTPLPRYKKAPHIDNDHRI